MKILVSSLVLCFSFSCYSQLASVSGAVSTATNQPLEFVNIIVLSSIDSTMAKAAVTDATGNYSLDNLSDGEYFVKCMMLGFEEWNSEKFSLVENENKVLQPIKLLEVSGQTGTVEYVYKKPLVQVEAGKTIFNVEGTINSAGLNAMELLRKAPGVMVDNNDNISVKGRSGIIVYIDGKLTPLDGNALAALLKSMQSSDIESIEIISNPSAKYDAAGSAGIINIKLKKNKNFGTNGNIQLGYAVQIYSKYNGSINLNNRNEKWNFFGNYSYNDQKTWGWMDLDRTQSSIRYNQTTVNVGESKFHNFKAGADHYLNDRNTIGVMISGNTEDGGSIGTSYTGIANEGSDVLNKELQARNITTNTRMNINANLNYHFSDTTGRDLMIDFDHGRFDINSLSFQPNTYTYPNSDSIEISNFRNNTPVLIQISSVKADYEQKALGGKLGAGFKSSYVSTENIYNFYAVLPAGDMLDSLTSNNFNYTENINAAYLNYNRQIKKLSVQAGVRAEQTNSEGKLKSFTILTDEDRRDVKRSYLNFFPSAALTYNHNDTNQFTLTYSRRIDRPSYQDLNPFEFKMDELSYQAGNPFLQPQYGNILELTHTYMFALNTSLTYSLNQDYFTNILDTSTTKAGGSFIQMQNIGYEEWMGFNISSPIPVGKKINLFLNANAGRKRIHSDLPIISESELIVWSYSFFGQGSLSLPKNVTLEVSGWYSGPSVWGATFVNQPMGSMDIAAKKEFWKGNASLRLALGDVFYTAQWTSRSVSNSIDMRARGGWESRQFRVSFSYNFGNQQMRVRDRKSGADDLKNRVK